MGGRLDEETRWRMDSNMDVGMGGRIVGSRTDKWTGAVYCVVMGDRIQVLNMMQRTRDCVEHWMDGYVDGR
eukprot:22884-Chlamydomonas_euryale.AAC.1